MKMFLITAITLLSSVSSSLATDGDAEAGKAVFKKCTACHNIDKPEAKVGPSLMGVLGRQPGALEGYKYSSAMVQFGEGKIWDEALLTSYLAKPKDIVKGTKMAFVGLKKEDDIANIVAYIKSSASAAQ